MTTESRIFSANLDHFSSKLNASLEKAIAEAVVNSFQAHATVIDVNIKTFTDGKMEYIEVIDNGDGFTDKNLESFFDLHSDYKKDIGGKGIGRATWFKFFSCISVNSTFIHKNIYKNISFIFERNSRNINIEKKISDTRENKTSVKMSIYFPRQQLYTLQSMLMPYLIKEMAIMLYRLKRKFEIHLNFFEEGKQHLSQIIDKNDVLAIEKKYDFDIKVERKKVKFTLNCIHLETTSGNKVETGFVAGERTLSNFEAALGLKVKAPTNQYSGQYWLLLESSIFNDGKFTSDDRERVIFPEGNDLWGSDIKYQIRSKLAAAIASYFEHIAPDYVTQKKEIIDEIYELYPQYAHPQYQRIIDEETIEALGRIDRHSLLKKLHEEDFSREYRFKNELTELMKSKKINEKSVEEVIESATKTSEQAKSILSNYFWYRKAIIEQLEIFINDNEKSEKLLHELFYKRFSTVEDIDLQNCIWLLDDKFMNFSYFASEGVIHDVITDIYGEYEIDHNSEKRMDLFIAFDSNQEETIKDCIVIEFKALGASRDEKANAASQVRRKYAQSIRRHAKNIGKIFIFIITYLDEITKEDLRSDDFRESVTRYGTIMNYYNYENDAHICFICASTIIGDAKDRHELFFKLLREELTQKQRLGIQSSIDATDVNCGN
jgi:hypothetical protein